MDAEFQRIILRSFRNQKLQEMVVCIQPDVLARFTPICFWSDLRICRRLPLLLQKVLGSQGC